MSWMCNVWSWTIELKFHFTVDDCVRSRCLRIFCINAGSHGNDCLHDPLPKPIKEAFKQSNVNVFCFFANIDDNQLMPSLKVIVEQIYKNVIRSHANSIYPQTGIQAVEIDVADLFIRLFSHRICFKQFPLSWDAMNRVSMDSKTFRDTVFT